MTFSIDPKTPKPQRLLLAAEYIIARDGVAASSLKDAAIIAGASKSAYQYYFSHHGALGQKPVAASSKDGVIQAIVEMRMEYLNPIAEQVFRYFEEINNSSIISLHDKGFALYPNSTSTTLSSDDIALTILIPSILHMRNSKQSVWSGFCFALFLDNPQSVRGKTSLSWGSLVPAMVELIYLKIPGSPDHASRTVDQLVGHILYGLSSLERMRLTSDIDDSVLIHEVALIMTITKARLDGAADLESCMSRARQLLSRFNLLK